MAAERDVVSGCARRVPARWLVAGLAATMAFGSAMPAHAAKSKKRPPITGMYQAHADNPDPTNALYDVGGVKPAPDRFPYSVCEGTVEGSRDVRSVVVKGAGRMVVDMDKFRGDWDVMLTDGNDRQVSSPNQGNKGFDDPTTISNESVEHVEYRAPRAMTIKIVACNRASWIGKARIQYKFTYS